MSERKLVLILHLYRQRLVAYMHLPASQGLLSAYELGVKMYERGKGKRSIFHLEGAVLEGVGEEGTARGSGNCIQVSAFRGRDVDVRLFHRAGRQDSDSREIDS